MKKYLFLLLFVSAFASAQVNPQKIPKLAITANVTDNTATKVNVQDGNGVINTIAKSDLIEVLEYASAINLPVTGLSGKVYVTIDSGRLYRWNGTIYNELSQGVNSIAVTDGLTVVNQTTNPTIGINTIEQTKITGLVTDLNIKENISNKQNSLAIDGTGVKYPTVDAVRTHTTDIANPHVVTKTQVGLANVDNTTDLLKPISTATQTALNGKIGGSGTIGALPVFTASGTLGNSIVTQTTNGISITDVNNNGFSGLGALLVKSATNTYGSAINIDNGSKIWSNWVLGSVYGSLSGKYSLFNKTDSYIAQTVAATGHMSINDSFTTGTGSDYLTVNGNVVAKVGSFVSNLVGVNAGWARNFGQIKASDNSTNILALGAKGSSGTSLDYGYLSTSPSNPWEAPFMTFIANNTIFGSITSNGIDRVQVNGTISALPATLSNQVVVKSQLDLKANIASPAFTGVPTVPTAAAGTNTTQIASTAFVLANGASNALLLTGNQTATGRKTVTSDDTNVGGINIINNRTTATAGTSDQSGLYINNLGASGLIAENRGTSGSTGISAKSINSGSALGVQTFSTGVGLELRNQGGTGDLLSAELGTTRITTTGALISTLPISAPNIPFQLKDFYSDVNNVGLTETDLLTYATPASRLNSAGEKIVSVYAGTMNDVTASSQLKAYFAGTLIADTGALTMSVTGAWVISASIIRTGATTARSIVNISTPGASTASYTKYTSLTGLTFTNTNIIKVTGTAAGATGGDNDITATYGNIIWQPAAL